MTLSDTERQKLKLLAAYCQENGSPGLDSWKSPAAHTRGILYWMWREVFAPDRLTPQQAQEWLDKTIADEQDGKQTGSGYSAQRGRKRSKNGVNNSD